MRKTIGLVLFIILSMQCMAQEYQWAVQLKNYISNETNKEPTAFLWIPSDCEQLRAVMVGQHNMSEENLFEMSHFRKALAKEGIGIIWISPGFSQNWDVKQGVQHIFNDMMQDLADVSGYAELQHIPIIPIGHSAMATFPWNFAAWNPERTLAIVSLHGDAPRTNLTGYGRENLEWGRTRNVNGIPGLMIVGEYEWWEARVTPALAFKMMYPESCISSLCDTGRGHFDVSEQTADYIALFIQKAMEQRYPKDNNNSDDIKLIPINSKEGWLAQRWQPNQKRRSKPAPYQQYKGDAHDAFWYIDGEMAKLTEDRYTDTYNKKEKYISFVQNGELLEYNADRHVRVQPIFRPLQDGITFHLHAAYSDSLYQNYSTEHISELPRITRVCGPVKVIDDTTFQVSFYRMGMNNPRRTGSINLVADCKSDRKYKGAVQHIGINIPYRNTDGEEQFIYFDALPDVNKTVQSVNLNATSNANLPVSFYVKEGPASVSDNTLTILPIPPKTKYPIKVTIVAWQYGIPHQVQTAQPIEQSFYIYQ